MGRVYKKKKLVTQAYAYRPDAMVEEALQNIIDGELSSKSEQVKHTLFPMELCTIGTMENMARVQVASRYSAKLRK